MIARLLGALFFVAAAPGVALAADMTGTWSIAGAMSPLCSFVQNGDALSGNCKGAAAEGPLTGSVSGSTIKWTYNWTTFADSSTGAFEFSGTLDREALSGTVVVNGSGRAFTARRMPGAAPIQLGRNSLPPPADTAPPTRPLNILDTQPSRTQGRSVSTAVASTEPLIRVSRSEMCTANPFPMMGNTPAGGRVIVEYLVGADGNVLATNLQSAAGNPMLTGFAVQCVRSWKFKPLSVTGAAAPFAAKAAVTVAFRNGGGKRLVDMQWVTPGLREASDIASYELAALAYNCLRANPQVPPLAHATTRPTDLIVTLRHGDVSGVSLKSSSGSDVLDGADLACYRGLPHDDERARALEKLTDLGISTSWQTLFP